MVVTAIDYHSEAGIASRAYSYSSTSSHCIKCLSDEEMFDMSYPCYEASGSFSPGENGLWKKNSGNSVYASFPEKPKLAFAVTKISEALQLSKSELADVIGVSSRQTLYNWINGKSAPRREQYKRLYELLNIAESFKQLGITPTADQLHLPVLNGLSILDLLKKSEIDKESVIFAGNKATFDDLANNSLADPFA